jgi:hypothetical protein
MAPRAFSRIDDALLRAFVWAYVGGIFGTLFLGLVRLFEGLDLPLPPELPAAACAGAVGALFYGSMRLAVLAALAGTLAGFGYLLLIEPPVPPVVMTATAALAGLFLGGVYGHQERSSRVFRADAKTLAGLFGGACAAALLALLTWAAGPLPLWLTTAVLCPVTGLVYIRVAPWFIARFQHLLPPAGDGALVGAAVAGFVGLALWVVVGELHSQVLGPYAGLARNLIDRLPEAAGGAILGASLAGFLSGLLGRDWYDL